MEPATDLVCSGVRFTNRSVSQLDGDRVSVSIPRDSIRHLSLGYGFQSERPLLQVLFGSIILAVGVWPVIRIARWLFFGGDLSTLEVLLVGFLIFGVWGVYSAVKRGYYILVETDRDRRKLAFSSPVARDDIQSFLADVHSTLDYEVLDELPDKTC